MQLELRNFVVENPAPNPGQSASGHFHSKAPYLQGSVTSLEAAEAIEPKVGTLRRAVLECIRSSALHGWTDEQIQRLTNMGPSTQRPRRVELMRAGLVVDSGRTRKTASGRNATVWVAA